LKYSTLDKRIEKSRAFYAKYKGVELYEYDTEIVRSILSKYLLNKPILLEGACGARNVFVKGYGGVKVGVDLDYNALKMNEFHNHKVCADLENLPFKSESVEVILSIDTIEHLENPEETFTQFYRILKNGEYLIIITPSKYHYGSILSIILPKNIKNLIWRVIRNKDNMPFPTYYKANTIGELNRICKKLLFSIEFLYRHERAPIWFLKFPFFFRITTYYCEFINRYSFFKQLRGSIIAVLRKAKSS